MSSVSIVIHLLDADIGDGSGEGDVEESEMGTT